MEIYLARHGRTNYNDLGLCNADPTVDVHLTETGVRQAKSLADKLKNAPIERIFISELKRTRQTADIVNAFHTVEIAVDARLNDGRSGYEGKRVQEYENALSAAADRLTARFNDGESIEDVKNRVSDFIDDLRTKDYGTIVIVTSLWIIQAMAALLQNVSNEEAWDLDIEPGSCMKLEV